jgi:xanthine dehydrogenase accessory factor
MDPNLTAALKELCNSDGAGALVTIISVKGSTPRKAGAKMLVRPDGQIFGTIGGGCGEAEVRREALHALDSLMPAKYVVNMNQELAADEGMVCGGVMEVFIDIYPPGQNKEKKWLLAYLSAMEKKEQPVLLTAIDVSSAHRIKLAARAFIPSSGKMASISEDLPEQVIRSLVEKHTDTGIPILITDGDRQFFIEPAQSTVRLIILGGGHIALPLCKMANVMGYDVTVIDDRPSFANRERFACAQSVICDDFLRALDSIELTAHSYIVIVTRGHRHDKLCLDAVINKPAAYLGMIGSKRRVKALMAEIMAEGIAPEAVANVHSPIGLKIGAQTSEEIAVSIIAEIIQVYRGETQQGRR